MITSASNHAVAMKALYEAEIERLVQLGFAEKGELVLLWSEDGEGLTLNCTSDRKIDDILKAAYPDSKIMKDYQMTKMNRKERRAAQRDRK